MLSEKKGEHPPQPNANSRKKLDELQEAMLRARTQAAFAKYLHLRGEMELAQRKLRRVRADGSQGQ